jgi:hypothetical protein
MAVLSRERAVGDGGPACAAPRSGRLVRHYVFAPHPEPSPRSFGTAAIYMGCTVSYALEPDRAHDYSWAHKVRRPNTVICQTEK